MVIESHDYHYWLSCCLSHIRYNNYINLAIELLSIVLVYTYLFIFINILYFILKVFSLFHSFPEDVVNLKRWIKLLQYFDPDFKYNSENCVICSKYFLQTDYTINIAGAEKLKKSSVPRIFPASGTVDIDLNTDNVNEQRLIISTISDNSHKFINLIFDNLYSYHNELKSILCIVVHRTISNYLNSIYCNF